MRKTKCIVILSSMALSLATVGNAGAQLLDGGTLERDNVAHNQPDYSPFVDQHMPNRVFWGDTHLHTSYSVDGGFFGNTLDPGDAYRFARGEELVSSTGSRVKLQRPLDWLVVADHAEYFGLADMLATGDPAILEDPVTARWYKMRQSSDPDEGMKAFYEVVDSAARLENLVENPAIQRTAWDKTTDFAEQYNDPGVFTSIIGFEWSSSSNGNNLHRVVMFRDGADRAGQVIPYSTFDSDDPEDLWDWMAQYEKATGGRILAAAHNGNWGTGLMFADERNNGEPLDEAYARKRIRYEPIYEMTQIKGDSETHPLLSPEDDWADFGTWDKGDLGGRNRITPEMLPHQYARSALRLGLGHEVSIGANPFKFGMIGSTDAHTSLATTREDNFFGKNPPAEPDANRWSHVFMKGELEGTDYYNWETLASGLTGVWARENTRKALFDAMNRKEVYATTGSRISVRVFGGWDFAADEVERPDFAERGYRDGVPMGGDLSNAPEGRSPTMMIRALRDPDNANLDRVQVVKGWLQADGKTAEKVYDVACSDGRAIVEHACERPVGSTVDVATASYTNTIGDPMLNAVWSDPDFDPSQHAFYYVRVLEIPKPTWQAHDVKYYGVKMDEAVPMSLQDRAYTSPIWYTPG